MKSGQLEEEAFEKLVINDQNFYELNKKIGGYCPFDALGAINSEIKNGNFLASLINPQYPHGYNAEFLRAFLIIVALSARENEIVIYHPSKREKVSPIDFHVSDLAGAKIRREWKNIDLLIEIPSEKTVLAVELKVNASQGRGQLNRYRSIVEGDDRFEGWAKLFVFLTKNEETPEGEEVDHWIPTKVGRLIESMESALEGSNASQLVRSITQAYFAMWRREHMDDNELEDLASKLWSEHFHVLSFLSDRKPDILADVFKDISKERDKLVGRLNECGGSWAADAQLPMNLKFAYLPWDELRNFKSSKGWTDSGRFVLFEIKREGPRYSQVSACLYLGPGNEESRSEYRNLVKDDWYKRGKLGIRWTCLAKKKWLYDASAIDEAEIDAKEARQKIEKGFIEFANKQVGRFDEVFAPLKG